MALDGHGALRYAGSFSWAALPHMAKVLKVHPQIAWERRHENRQFWYEELNRLREHDPAFLARMVIRSGNVAAGLRDRLELEAVKAARLFDSIVWVHRPGFPTDSTVTFSRNDATDYLLNDGSLDHFRETVLSWAALKGYITH